MILAVTGGTGFLGGHVLRIAAGQGHRLRALARRPQEPMPRVEWVSGALDDPDSLAALCAGADAVLHIAGAINAPDRAGFVAANMTGTGALLDAARAAGVRRFVHVSSLSAREPELSNYGWSKASSEALVRQSSLDWTIVRPPAIYGAGDREMLELFRLARHKGIVPLPPGGRLSLIEGGDLARFLLALVEANGAAGQTYEPDDGTETGYGQREFGKLVAAAVGRPGALVFGLPAFVLRLGALLERLRLGDRAKLTRDRVNYFCHPDWVVKARPPASIWQPQVRAAEGLRATADWYREQGWL